MGSKYRSRATKWFSGRYSLSLAALFLFVAAIIPVESKATVFTVYNTNAVGDSSFAQAILDANGNPGKDNIHFNIPGSGPHTIVMTSSWPDVTDSVIIDGYTQPGASPSTNSPGLGSNAVMMIELDASCEFCSFGLLITAGNSTVRGLVINGNPLGLRSNGNNVIEGNYLGTDVTGSVNLGGGLQIGGGTEPSSSSNNTIGGLSAGASNVILGGSTSIWSHGNSVLGNYIGTDASATVALGFGLFISSSNNVIGGTAAGSKNIIHFLSIGGETNRVEGNYIGTDFTGTQPLVGGGGTGVSIGGSNNIVGGTAPGARNIISGNQRGILIASGGHRIEGNYIGTDVTGTVAVPNSDYGVGISAGASDITIGGTMAAARNIISGNGQYGVYLTSLGGNQVQGNYIGTDVSGTCALGNSTGVYASSCSDTIGGTIPEARNIISGNLSNGITLKGSPTCGSVILGNYIGTDVTGTISLPNLANGIFIDQFEPFTPFLGSPHTIGGTAAGAGNIISGNGLNGILISAGEAFGFAAGSTVEGNSIGTDTSGTSALPNSLHGVCISSNVSGNVIGGSSIGAGNTIAFNDSSGMFVDSGSGIENTIRSNSIFSNAGLGIDLAGLGVTINDMGDGDAGPNNLQNYPVLTAASSVGDSTCVQGTLNSTANAEFTLEFFSNVSCDSSGNGEGQELLGCTNVTTDGTGDAGFLVTFPTAVTLGEFVTATATDSGGSTSEFSECEEVQSTPIAVSDPVVPKRFALYQNAPNPFNPTTTISFSLVEGSRVHLAVYDVAGKLVRTLVDELRDSAMHQVTWDGTDNRGREVASGVYFYRLVAGDFTDTKKMVLLK